MRFLLRLIFLSILIQFNATAWAQQETLPQGIGMYSFGYRAYSPQTHTYNNDGHKVSLAEPFKKDFNGENLLKGFGGNELQQLAQELKKFDGVDNNSNLLLKTLSLGHLDASVQADINAKIFGLGYGVRDNLTLFIGAPFIEATVNTELNFTGENNAQLIKQRLGQLAFEQLRAGLDRASQITTQTILDSIYSLGYDDISRWHHSGIGDVQIGSIWGHSRPIARKLYSIQSLKTSLSLPTGYVDDPNKLTDVSLGKGYYLLTNQLTQKVRYRNVWLGADLNFGIGLPTTVKKRLPEQDETLVAADRTIDAQLTPGHDLGYGLQSGAIFGVFKTEYRLGVQRHFSDKYSGSLDGNYDKLAEKSSQYELYHEPSLSLDTVSLYQRKRFMIPLILQLKYHQTLEARNHLDDRYYELSLSSFFKTPAASSKSLSSKKRQKAKLGKKSQKRKYSYRHH